MYNNSLALAEKQASGAMVNNAAGIQSPVGAAIMAEQADDSYYTGSGKKASLGGLKDKISGLASSLPLLLIGGILAIALIVIVPVSQVHTLINSLMESLGFNQKVAILEEKCEYATAEAMKNGEISEDYFARLTENNIEVGQVTLAGEFVETNTYLAYLDEDIASTSEAYSDKTGELVFRFEGEIITADNFVATVESNSKLYAAYSDALNVSSRFYYSEEVDDIYDQLGISRNDFSAYEETSDNETNRENYQKLLSAFLDKNNSTTIQVELNGDDCRSDHDVQIYSGSESSGLALVTAVDDATYNYDWEPVGRDENDEPIYECKRQDGTQRNDEAATLLNTAVSSLEPYETTKAFMAIAEPLQQAQAGDNGAVNQVMNTITTSSTVTIQDANTGETTTVTESVLENKNFLAAITYEDYSAEEAANFSRDRLLIATGMNDDSEIEKNNAATGTQQSAARNSDYSSSTNKLLSAAGILDNSLYTNKSETLGSTIGANQIIEGGSFLSNKIGSVIGSLASDSETIASYQQEIQTIATRQAEADRATLSPFDISSKNTFLGRIVYNFATAMTYYSARTNNNLTLSSISGSALSLAKNSIASLAGVVSANEYMDGYLGTNGLECPTLESTGYGLSGDIYCTQHETIDTDYMSWTLSDFVGSEIGGEIDSETGEITDERGDLMETLALGMDRGTSVGVSNAEVCKRYREDFGNAFQRTVGKMKGLLGVTCDAVDEVEVSIGTKYTLSDKNENSEVAHLASAYALYQMSRKIIGEANEVTAARERYYEENPLDNSMAGILARVSGLSTEEAQVAINYASYLNYIASYDPSTRYSFNNHLEFDFSLFDDSDVIQLEQNDDLYEAMAYVITKKDLFYTDNRENPVLLG